MVDRSFELHTGGAGRSVELPRVPDSAGDMLPAASASPHDRPLSATVSQVDDLDVFLEGVMPQGRFQGRPVGESTRMDLSPQMQAPSRADIHSTYHLAADLSLQGQSVEAAFNKAQQICLTWAQNLFPASIPAIGMQGGSTSLDIGGHRLDLVSVHETGDWSLRLTHPDLGLGDGRPPVAGRTWTTDIALRQGESRVHLAAQVRCASSQWSDDPILHTGPRPIADMARQMTMCAHPMVLSQEPLEVSSQEDLGLLQSLVEDKERELPVVVLTNPGPQYPHLRPWVVDPADLANRLLGQAHVVMLPQNLTYAWSDKVSQAWGVYKGAVRVYKPGLDRETQSCFAHPLATLDRILNTPSKAGQLAEDAFAERLIEDVGRYQAEGLRKPSQALFVPEARATAAEIERRQAMAQFDEYARSASVQGQIDLIKGEFQKEIDSLRQQLMEAKHEAEWALNEAAAMEQERDQARGEANSLRWQVATLREQQAAGGPAREEPLPTTFEAIPDWAERNFGGRLAIHPRAKRELKHAVYKDVELVAKALQLLADDYQPMRMGMPGAKERFERRMSEMRLSESGSIDVTRAGQEGKEYFVRWPLGNHGRDEFVDRHLRHGTSRDARHCLAIYFFYDKDTQQVVVGSLPKHLDNQLT